MEFDLNQSLLLIIIGILSLLLGLLPTTSSSSLQTDAFDDILGFILLFFVVYGIITFIGGNIALILNIF